MFLGRARNSPFDGGAVEAKTGLHDSRLDRFFTLGEGGPRARRSEPAARALSSSWSRLALAIVPLARRAAGTPLADATPNRNGLP